MVAELTGISVPVAEKNGTKGQRSGSNDTCENNLEKICNRPQWIKTAIRERSYSVFDNCDSKKNPLEVRREDKLSSIEEEPIYSVVNKRNKLKMSSLPDQSVGHSRKIVEQDEWLNSVAIPRGVTGMINSNYYGRISKNPSEINESIVQEEIDMISTAVDSINNTIGRNWNDLNNCNNDADQVIDPQVQQRAKWRIIPEDNHNELKNEDNCRDSFNDEEEEDDGSLPKYCLKNEANCYVGTGNEAIEKQECYENHGQ